LYKSFYFIGKYEFSVRMKLSPHTCWPHQSFNSNEPLPPTKFYCTSERPDAEKQTHFCVDVQPKWWREIAHRQFDVRQLESATLLFDPPGKIHFLSFFFLSFQSLYLWEKLSSKCKDVRINFTNTKISLKILLV